MTRVAVVDVGTNSTRLLVADVTDGEVEALDRRSIVTRLGEGLERSGALGEEPMARVLRALDEYAQAMEEHGVEVRTGVMTSAVRDASNGPDFMARVREDYDIDATTLTGDEEAQLTYAGAAVGRQGPMLVADIGGGSTELVTQDWHVSTQVGVVRHTERHGEDIDALRADARAVIRDALAADGVGRVESVVAVAGTATMAASMELELDPYDADAVEGYRLTIDTLRERLATLHALDPAARRDVPGLHPDRAPTIVAGIAILIEVLEAAGADEVEVSDRDLLYGRALQVAT